MHGLKEVHKEDVRSYWNARTCGTNFSDKDKYSKEYFNEIERCRYHLEPEILSFAQFEKFKDKRVLEVGVGAGTDFLQWVRAGAKAYGIDLTPEGVNHVKRRLEVYGLTADDVRVADCESLPYEDNTFDLVYSWGVIHHTPDMPRALKEIVRVCRNGGTCKIMVYNRYSLTSLYVWIREALLKARPWKSFSWCIYNYVESIGTKAHTKKEVKRMLVNLPVEKIQIETVLTHCDTLKSSKNNLFKFCAKVLAMILGGNRVGWFMTIEFNKKKKPPAKL
ncbi:MAG: class I SAM-dependent methyltransferase [Nitrospirota bacterium]